MDPPIDGEEVARVIPLRRRDGDLTAVPPVREALPRERAAFDPEIEPGDVVLQRRRGRFMAVLSDIARHRPPTLRSRRPRIRAAAPLIALLVAPLIVAAAVAVIQPFGASSHRPGAHRIGTTYPGAQLDKVQTDAVAKNGASTRSGPREHHRTAVNHRAPAGTSRHTARAHASSDSRGASTSASAPVSNSAPAQSTPTHTATPPTQQHYTSSASARSSSGSATPSAATLRSLVTGAGTCSCK